MISTPDYSGPDRRIAARRKEIDRREMIRFEPSKDPRRTGQDRRKTLNDDWERRDI
ncbi:MAG: hypothetical protein ACC653_07900 [Gammaproteobacteria bacterium]